MNTVYPMEEKASAPPTYEQATYFAQGPQVTTTYSMYSTPGLVMPPQGHTGGIYSTMSSGMPYSTSAAGAQFVVSPRSMIYGDLPLQCICPNCHQMIQTRVEKRTGLVSWLACAGICLFGGGLGCCLIPFCIDSLQDIEHYCPQCAILLGTRRKI